MLVSTKEDAAIGVSSKQDGYTRQHGHTDRKKLAELGDRVKLGLRVGRLRALHHQWKLRKLMRVQKEAITRTHKAVSLSSLPEQRGGQMLGETYTLGESEVAGGFAAHRVLLFSRSIRTLHDTTRHDT